MSERLDRFVNLMRGIFELDKSDLDFGIYRIINIRQNEINNFLKNGLPKKVQEALAPFAANTEEIESRIKDIEKICSDVGVEVSNSKMDSEYAELKSKLASGVDMSSLEADVYSALYSFFNRYYDEGDFISKRRYKEGVYAIPYEGEEVKLYWANQDQYYIKTAENFKDYTFVARNQYGDNVTVHFMLVDATTEQNNNKENDSNKRTFMLFEENDDMPGVKTMEYLDKTNELIVRFVFDVPKDKKVKWANKNSEIIRTTIAKDYPQLINILLNMVGTDKKKQKTLIDKHLETYVAKNTFDYFIHKDLGKFLRQELDFFIKSEIIHLDDIDTTDEKRVESYLAKVRAIKRVGHIIIDFLTQIENFQKKLWLKKKFIVETNWCITLDRIDEDLWPEIIDNKKQIEEWIDMYAINEVEDSLTNLGWSNPPSIEFLKQNQNLIVDTKHFSSDFKDRLISSFDDLDKQTDGLLIHSENFQALRLLMNKYREKINLIYIDPPYNTDASKILYKNGYEHSSWISLMSSRLEEAKKILNNKGVIEVAIDDYELRYLSLCLDQVFGLDNCISNISILTNPKGRDQGFIAQAHDYSVVYAKNKSIAETYNFILSDDELMKKFSKSKGGESLRELPLKRTGTGKRREERPYMYFPFFYNPKTNDLIVIPEELYKGIYDPDTNMFNDHYLESIIKEYKNNGYEAILPLSASGEKLRWRWGYNSCIKGIENGVLFCKSMTNGGYAIYQYDFADSEVTPKSLWFGEKYDASSKGTNILENIIPQNPFDYPKSLYTVEDNIIIGSKEGDYVLDFFAGSGTTGHAVIDLNRTLQTRRKFILVDMGEYFDSVIKQRIKKVAYSPEWKRGKPNSHENGISQIIKYFSLESYEDALSNIDLIDNGGMTSLFGDEYVVHYMLDTEANGSLLDIEQFENPFDYKLKISEVNDRKIRNIDVIETFNYLIGLSVSRQSTVQYYSSQKDVNGEYDGAVKLVKDINGNYGFKQIEGTLPDGQRALIIWRTISDDLLASNAALDAYFLKHRINPLDREFDIIYVNGDNNLENLKNASENWKVNMTEIEFKKRMFEEE